MPHTAIDTYPHMFLTWREMNYALRDIMRYAETIDESESPREVDTLGVVYDRIAHVMDFITERSMEMGTYEDESSHKHPIPFTQREFGVLCNAKKHFSHEQDAKARMGWPTTTSDEFFRKVDKARASFTTAQED
jgi:hypothetical protein